MRGALRTAASLALPLTGTWQAARTSPVGWQPRVDNCRGTIAEFEASNRRRRQRELAQYVATMDADTRDDVLQALRRDLTDLGLGASDAP